jgi:hypothetical protein
LYVDDEKKATKGDDTVFYCSHYQRRKYSQNSSHTGKIKRGREIFAAYMCNLLEGKSKETLPP